MHYFIEQYFTEEYFEELYDFAELERTVASTVRLAAKDPLCLYLFFQRYTHFNSYASAVISRLASSISLSRYLFNNPESTVTEQADRGMDIAALVLSAAADEGANESPVHRALAQYLLKILGDYGELSSEERNQFAEIPTWLRDVIDEVIINYSGTPNNLRSLVRAMGFHLASEMLGDREYSLIDMVVRHENKGLGFDSYLRQNRNTVNLNGHRYKPWAWVVIHSRHNGSGAEAEHSEYATSALNMTLRYSSASKEQLMVWVQEGFDLFVELQQRLFREIFSECLKLSQEKAMPAEKNNIAISAEKNKTDMLLIA